MYIVKSTGEILTSIERTNFSLDDVIKADEKPTPTSVWDSDSLSWKESQEKRDRLEAQGMEKVTRKELSKSPNFSKALIHSYKSKEIDLFDSGERDPAFLPFASAESELSGEELSVVIERYRQARENLVKTAAAAEAKIQVNKRKK